MPDFKEGWPDVEHTSCNSTSHKTCLPNAVGKTVFLLCIRNGFEFSIALFHQKQNIVPWKHLDLTKGQDVHVIMPVTRLCMGRWGTG